MSSAVMEYGLWAAANPECVIKSGVGTDIKIFQLCWCIMCACQAFFFAIRYPRVTWEFVLVPLVEAVVYGLGYSGIGYVVLQSGRTVAWMRICLWVITAPVLLMQISDIATVRFYGISLSTMQIPMSIITVVFAFSAEVSVDEGVKWMFFVLALLTLFEVLFVAYHSLSRGIARFAEVETEEGNQVAKRLRALLVIFLSTWLLHPLFFVLSIEGACVMHESVTIVLYILLDLFCKNLFQIILWDSLWVRLLGKWRVEDLVIVQAQEISGYEPEDYKHDEVNLSVAALPITAAGSPGPRVAGDVVLRSDSARAMRQRMQYPSAGEHPALEYEGGVPPPYPGGVALARGELDLSPRALQSRYAADLEGGMYASAGAAGSRGGRTPAHTGAARSGRAGTQSMDEVVDHVKLLNQALSDLLVTDPGSKAAQQRPMPAV